MSSQCQKPPSLHRWASPTLTELARIGVRYCRSLALEPVADRLRLCKPRLKNRRPLRLAPVTQRLVRGFDLSRGSLGQRAVIGAVGGQHHCDAQPAKACRPVERNPLARELLQRSAIGVHRTLEPRRPALALSQRKECNA